MSKPRFLFDECMHGAIKTGLQRLEPAIDILQVGDPGAPPRATQDPDLLFAAESLARVLVTSDKKTMVRHLMAHYQAGHHTAGLILLRPNFSIGRYVQSILQQWATTTADEWIDRTMYLP